MKKLLLTVFVAFVAMLSASAQYSAPEVFANNPDQVVPGLKYRKVKKLYDPKNYVYLADPAYGTRRAWFNLLVPGLAQLTMGETGRGIRHMAIGLISEALFASATTFMMTEDTPEDHLSNLSAVLLFGTISAGNYIWSIADAKKVAKVKSQYLYDVEHLGRQVSFTTSPFLAPVRIGDQVQPAAGVTFAMRF